MSAIIFQPPKLTTSRRCVETALLVAEALDLSIKVEPGICEILTVRGGGWVWTWENPWHFFLSKMAKVRNKNRFPNKRLNCVFHCYFMCWYMKYECYCKRVRYIFTGAHHKIWTDSAGFASQQSARSTLQGFWTQINCSNTLGPKTQLEGHLIFGGEVKSSNSTVWLLCEAFTEIWDSGRGFS